MSFTKEEKEWIVYAIDNFKIKTKEEGNEDLESLNYFKNLIKIVNESEEINTPTIEFIAKALRLYLKKYDPKVEDNLSSILMIESILNKSEAFLTQPIIK
jgi:hypothetical protein